MATPHEQSSPSAHLAAEVLPPETTYEITDLPLRDSSGYNRQMGVHNETDAYLAGRGVGTYIDHPSANDPTVVIARDQSEGVVMDGTDSRRHFDHPVAENSKRIADEVIPLAAKLGYAAGSLALDAVLETKKSAGLSYTLREDQHAKRAATHDAFIQKMQKQASESLARDHQLRAESDTRIAETEQYTADIQANLDAQTAALRLKLFGHN